MKDLKTSENSYTKALIIKYRLCIAEENGYKTSFEKWYFATDVLCMTQGRAYRLLREYPEVKNMSFTECKKALIQQSDFAYKVANLV